MFTGECLQIRQNRLSSHLDTLNLEASCTKPLYPPTAMIASGFTAAPVSQLLFFGVIAFSILVSITDTKYLFYIQVVPHIWQYKQAWRLLIWQVNLALFNPPNSSFPVQIRVRSVELLLTNAPWKGLLQ